MVNDMVFSPHLDCNMNSASLFTDFEHPEHVTTSHPVLISLDLTYQWILS